MSQKRLPIPPKHLQAAGRRLWKRVVTDYSLEPWQLEVLAAAAEAADRMTMAREKLDQDGLIVEHEKFGIRAHPCIAIERDSRTAMLRALRELSLDAEVIESSARPPYIAAGRRFGR